MVSGGSGRASSSSGAAFLFGENREGDTRRDLLLLRVGGVATSSDTAAPAAAWSGNASTGSGNASTGSGNASTGSMSSGSMAMASRAGIAPALPLGTHPRSRHSLV